MTEKHWAVSALIDIRQALDQDRYDVAICHIDDAIAAIKARDDQDFDPQEHEPKHAKGDLPNQA